MLTSHNAVLIVSLRECKFNHALTLVLGESESFFIFGTVQPIARHAMRLIIWILRPLSSLLASHCHPYSKPFSRRRCKSFARLDLIVLFFE